MKKMILLIQFSFLFFASYGQCVCDPPGNVSATMHTPSWFDVEITWDYPECADVRQSTISLAGTSFSSSIGFGDSVPCDIYPMHRFLPSELADYDGMLLSGISFYPSVAGASYYLRVYSGGSYDATNGFDPGQLLVEQDVTGLVTVGQLNTFSLNTPIVIDASEELWIGYRAVANAGFPAGATSGVAYPNRSEIIGWQDTLWNTLTASSLSYSWIIQGHIISDLSGIVGFDLYKDGSLLTSLPNTMLSYTDPLVSVGTHTYGVKTNWNTPCTSTEATVNIDMPDDPCVAGITQLPYQDNFDRYTPATTPFPPCWYRFTTQTNNPYVSTTYSASSPNSLYFYSTSSTYSMAVLPKVDDAIDLSSTQLKFKLHKGSASYDLQIGIMSDTADFSTFQLIKRVSPSTTYTWEEFIVYFNEYEGSGKFVVFLSDQRNLSVNNIIYIDDVELDYYPDCIEPSNLELLSINGFSAMITWQPPAINQPVEYVVEISDDGGLTWQTSTTQNTFYIFSALDERTIYLARVASSCDEGNSNYIQITMLTDCSMGGEHSIGTGTETTYEFPVNNYYRYTLTQQIYLATEFTGATELFGISFEYAYTNPSTLKNDVTIYLAHTTKSSFSGSSDWDNTPLTLVYSGPLNCSQGWNNFEFTTPFQYNGTDNLLVVVDDNSNNYNGSSYVFNTHATTGIMTIHAYSDSGNPSPTSLPPSGVGTASEANRVNTKFILPCSESDACYAPGLYVNNVDHNSADIFWTLATGLSDFVLEYKSNLENSWTEITPTDDYHHLGGLNSNTSYQVRIKTVCPTDESDWVILYFLTECGQTLEIPFFEDFQHNGANYPSYPMPTCWERGGDAGTYPYQSTSYGLNSSTSLYFYNSSSAYCTAILPAIPEDVSLEELQLTFNLYKTSDPYELQVGVMTDPSDDSTFQLIRTVSPTTTSAWEEFTLYFTAYADTGRYIVFKSDRRVAASSNYMYMDDVSIEYTPDCSTPVNLAASYVGGTSALLTWEDGPLGEIQEYIIEVYDESTEDWTAVNTVTNPYCILDDLAELTTYSYRVQATCNDSESMYAVVTFGTGCVQDSVSEIGTATTNSISLPVNNFYKYTLSQQIYTASEVGGPKMITGVAFQYDYVTASTLKTDVDIYLGHTTKSSFSSTSDWESVTSFHKYYSGHFNCSQGWNTFALDSAFTYNGVDNLIIMIDDNSNNYNGSAHKFAVDSVSGNLSIYYYSDGTNPSVSAPPTASSHSSTLRNNIKFVECTDNYTCAPSNVMAYNVSHNSADIAWTASGTASSWVVEYKAQNDTVWTSLGTLTSTTHSFTQLDMNTTYSVRIYTDCAAEMSVPTEISFTTECGYMTALPYIENFDNYGTGSSAYPACWTRKSNYGTYPYLNTLNYASSPASYYFYCSSSTYSLSSVSALDDALSMSDVSVEFSIYASTAMTAIYVGVMSDPLDEATFELIEKIDLPYGTRMNYHIPFNSYTGTGKYITFKADGLAQGYTQAFYMDNLVIDAAPVCARPLNISVSDITLTDCNVRWDATDGIEYEVVIGPVGFDPDLATNGYTTTDTFYVFANELTPETQYDVYVRTICGSGDESDWSFAVTFWSACRQGITFGDLPYTEVFDAWGTGNSAISFPNCWGRISNYSSNYPYISSSNTTSAPGALYFYGASSYNYTVATLPMISPTIPLDTLELKFNIYAYNNSSGIEVGVMTSPTDNSTFTSVGQIIVPTAEIWEEAEFDFSSYTGTGHYIALRYIGSYSSVYVDDVKLDILSSCQKPADLEYTSVTAADVTLSWTERGDATTWEIEYGSSGFTPGDGTGTLVIANTNPYTVQGLTDDTNYDFYVRSICTIGDTSDWSSSFVSVLTLCNNNITVFPHTEDFEYNGTWPECWRQEYVSGTTNWTFQGGGHNSNPSGAQSGSYNALFQYSGRGPSSRLISPVFDFSGYENAYITFWHAHLTWSGDQDELAVYYQTTTSDNWILLDTYSNSTSWTYDSLALPNVGNSTRVCFVGTSDYGYGVCIDNIMVNATLQEIDETCLPPHTLTVPTATITANSAVINWQAGGTETSWMVEYKKGSDNYSSAVVASPTYTLQSLQPLTLYDVRVKALCGTEESQYASTTFTTLSDSVQHYTITVICGSNGSISPAGPSIDVRQGSDLGLSVTPNSGYKILQVKIDDEDVDVDNDTSYFHMFSDIQSDHSIEAHFTYTSIDDYEKENNVQLYPNPTNSMLNVVLSSRFDQVEITNIMGQTIFMNSVNDLTFILNVSDYNAGVYFIRLSGVNGVVVKKFVKK